MCGCGLCEEIRTQINLQVTATNESYDFVVNEII